jgi:hypothetical protein
VVSERVGVPGLVGAAVGEYRRQRAEVEKRKVSEAEADDVILAEARARGGVAREGERIDLSYWSERMAIRRDVLEALVLAIQHANAKPPAAELPIAAPPEERADVPMTPPPPATRHPFVEPSCFEFFPMVNEYAYTSNAYFLAHFRFPDEPTMKACLAGLGDAARGARTSTDGLELFVRIDDAGLNAVRVREVAHALTALPLHRYCVRCRAR